jgi:hypothetical protein
MKRLLYVLLFAPVFLHAQTINITTPKDTICSGSFVHFKAVVSGITTPHFKWQINSSSAGTDSLGFTTHTLNDNDTVSCLLTNGAGDTVFAVSNKHVMTVEYMPVVSPITGNDSLVCVGATITLSDKTTGGLWQMSDTNYATVVTGIVTGVAGGTGGQGEPPTPDTILYIIANACGADTAEKVITVEGAPYAGTGLFVTNICVDQTVPADDLEENLYVRYGYVAFGMGFLTGIRVGRDYVYHVVANACGVDSSGDWVTVRDKSSITAIISPSQLCAGDSVALADSTNGSSPVWRTSSNIATVNKKGVITGHQPGIDTIILSVSNYCGITTKSTTINISPPGEIAGFIDSVCLGNSSALPHETTGGMWRSSNPAVATVDQSGNVHSVALGETIISYAYGSCTVSAKIKITPELPGITGDAVVCQGGTISLADDVDGGTWRTDTLSFAAVDSNGWVTGLSAGAQQITYQVSGCITTKEVRVERPNLISGPANVCVHGDITLDGIDHGKWTTPNSDIVSIDIYTGKVAGISEGFATITYTQNSGCIDTKFLTVTNCDEKISVFPNPAKKDLTLQVDSSFYFGFSMVNSTGQVMMQQSITGMFTHLDIQMLPPGIYLLTFFGYNDNYTAKFRKE